MASAALSAKADDVVILDLRKVSFSFDFFVLFSAPSDRRLQTIAEHIEEELASRGIRAWHEEGRPEGGWILLDYRQVIAHIFDPEVRRFYDLERLWADAPRVPFTKKRKS